MCNTLQRYKFESNSQRLLLVVCLAAGCVIPCKDTNLKAIHNDINDTAELTGDV